VDVPVIHPLGMERQRGHVAVVAISNAEIAAGEGAGQAAAIDVRRLPAEIVAMTAQPILLAYRTTGEQGTIPLTIRRHSELPLLVTVNDSALFTCMQLADGRRITKAIYTVRNNRNQFLRLTMPAGAEVWSASVGGSPVSAATDEAGRILLPLVRSMGQAAELAAFPVELVYVETPLAKTAAASGHLHVELPRADCPILHVMVNYYLPAEGQYGVKAGLFGGAPTGAHFTGTLEGVKEFASLSREEPANVPPAAAAAQQLQQQADVQWAAKTAAAGSTPIRVRLPLDGKLFRLEKILALPGDKLYFDLDYRGWGVK
jgi:hypothetical protein